MSLFALLAAAGAPSTPEPAPTPLGALEKWWAALDGRATNPAVIVSAGDSLTDMDATSIDSSGWTARLARKIAADLGEPVSFHNAGEDTGWDPTPTRAPGVHLVNVATSGRTSYNYLGTQALPNLIAARPDLVMHMVGMNNYSFTTNSPQSVVNDIAGRITKIDANLAAAGHPAPVHVLMVEPRRTPPLAERPADWWDVYGSELLALAAADPEWRILVDVDAAFGADAGLRGSDGIHLTAEGYERTAATVHAALARPAQ